MIAGVFLVNAPKRIESPELMTNTSLVDSDPAMV